MSGGHARAFNRRHGRRGALFEARYADRTIRDGEHLAAAVAYVEQNAVSAGMVDAPEAWPWSTYKGCGMRKVLARCLTPEVCQTTGAPSSPQGV